MSRSAAGTATTAEAVSWVPTATTVVAAGKPVRAATSAVIGPTVSPGSIKRREQLPRQAERVERLGRP